MLVYMLSQKKTLILQSKKLWILKIQSDGINESCSAGINDDR